MHLLLAFFDFSSISVPFYTDLLFGKLACKDSIIKFSDSLVLKMLSEVCWCFCDEKLCNWFVLSSSNSVFTFIYKTTVFNDQWMLEFINFVQNAPVKRDLFSILCPFESCIKAIDFAPECDSFLFHGLNVFKGLNNSEILLCYDKKWTFLHPHVKLNINDETILMQFNLLT